MTRLVSLNDDSLINILSFLEPFHLISVRKVGSMSQCNVPFNIKVDMQAHARADGIADRLEKCISALYYWKRLPLSRRIISE